MVGGMPTPHSLEDAGAHAQTLGPQSEAFAVVLDDDLLECTQVVFDVGPRKGVPRRLEAAVQLLSEHQGKKQKK